MSRGRNGPRQPGGGRQQAGPRQQQRGTRGVAMPAGKFQRTRAVASCTPKPSARNTAANNELCSKQ